MKFAFVIPNLAGGGAEKAVLKIATALLERGHLVGIVLLENFVEHAIPEGIQLQPLSAAGQLQRGWLGKRLLARRLARMVSSLGPDVVVSTLPFADEVSFLAGLSAHWCRIANTLSEEIDLLSRRSSTKADRRRRRYREIYGRRSLIAVSQGVADDLHKNLRIQSTIRVIGNPFDIDGIRKAAAEREPRIPEGPYVIHVGRFAPQKRHDLLLDAWLRVGKARHLVLLTQDSPALQSMIAERLLSDRVSVVGFQSNPYPWIHGADLLVLCSDHEGLPNVLIESLICGTPVVSTDCPSGPREILGGQFPESLVPRGDAVALADAIERTLASPPELETVDLSRFGSAYVASQFEQLGVTGDLA